MAAGHQSHVQGARHNVQSAIRVGLLTTRTAMLGEQSQWN
ncbi:MAG: hypothetical protein QOE32_7443 [Pseudonocardiales bacterium]|jgi:hypothetical protein|nr:hypothetical protein [Pseudonocardiales bacterium]MDT7589893.1 hypothetical protein [Pseudonocardiales bacterium]